MSYQEYQTLYGVGLLDDLHNYFPALLYDSSSFANVGDVLAYIQGQTRLRFDLFSRGSRDYRAAHSSAAAPQPQRPLASPVSPVTPQQQSAFPLSTVNSVLNLLNANRSTLHPSPIQTVGRTIPLQYSFATTILPEGDEDQSDEEIIETALQNVIRQAAHSLYTTHTNNHTGIQTINIPLTRRAMDAFMQPIVVRPTPEQITANTTLGNLVSDEDYECSICRENLQPEQEARKLNACGHWFHKSCIDTWFQQNVHCPLCRHDIRVTVRPNQEQPETNPQVDV